MPCWKYLLLYAYYHASLPRRWWITRTLAARQRTPIISLFYHRIADDAATEWTMPERTFIDQVTWLRQNFELISMEEVQRRLRSGVNTRPALHITFDDGYADNCRAAIPWLIKERIPCTYFVTMENIMDGRPFAHDLKLGLNLRPNSLDEIRAMAAAGIEIGAHTYCHPDLGKVTDPVELNREIVTARHELQDALGRDVRYFAFPFGQYANLSCRAFELAARSGYEGVCSAYGGYNFPGDDAFHVQRIPTVCEMLRMKNWLNADHRKLYTRRFEYHWNDESVDQSCRKGSMRDDLLDDAMLSIDPMPNSPSRREGSTEEAHVLST
jgi:peptidoglycan/xylan/chitin deacetylase (PgdA/CDA1 family)